MFKINKLFSPDTIGMLCGMLGASANIGDVRISTSIWLVSNVGWLVWGLRNRAWKLVAMQVFYLVVNVMALVVRWNNP
jgi:hypothetical protein